MKVLIAEDEPHIAESLDFVLGRAGYDVVTAADGDAAVIQMSASAPDVVILDIMLPRRNGFEILKWIRSNPELEHTRVLILTAKGQERDRRTATTLGVDAFMTKPFSNREVVACIDRLSGRESETDR